MERGVGGNSLPFASTPLTQPPPLILTDPSEFAPSDSAPFHSPPPTPPPLHRKGGEAVW